MLTREFFINNRRRLRELVDSGSPIVITAHSQLQRSLDTVYPFRQESNFYYLTGIEEPSVILVMVEDQEFMIMPKRSKAENIFNGKVNYQHLSEQSGVGKIYDHKEGWEIYKKVQRRYNNLYTLLPSPSRVSSIDSFYTNPTRRNFVNKLKSLFRGSTIKNVGPHLISLRQVKQSEEVLVMKKAISITRQGLNHARRMIAAGAMEYEVEAEITNVFTKNGARHAYQPIVASGSNSIDLHYIKNNNTLRDGDVLLIDVGAEYMNYAADVTRTYPVSSFSKRQADVYSSVSRVQKWAVSKIYPGATWKEFFKEVDEVMAEELVGLGLISSKSRDQVRKYFPHGISHSLGLDVHDVCSYASIDEGMVITVEPGVYIPEESFGVRIEDNILITSEGVEWLTEGID